MRATPQTAIIVAAALSLFSVPHIQFATSFQPIPHNIVTRGLIHSSLGNDRLFHLNGGPQALTSRLHLSKDDPSTEKSDTGSLGSNLRRSLLASTAAAIATNVVLSVVAPPGFKRIPTQFIAGLGDPDAKSGTNAQEWGIWEADPGPRGVFLQDYPKLEENGGKASAGWNFDQNDWWLEEHGLIMEKPKFSLPAGRYLVTGGRLVTTVLTVDPPSPSEGGIQRWKLDNGKLYDVTHLPCRAARYKPNEGNGSPLTARKEDFPVKPGAVMPSVQGCDKQDYAVLFVIGVAT